MLGMIRVILITVVFWLSWGMREPNRRPYTSTGPQQRCSTSWWARGASTQSPQVLEQVG